MTKDWDGWKSKPLPKRSVGDSLPPDQAMAAIVNREAEKIEREENGDG